MLIQFHPYVKIPLATVLNECVTVTAELTVHLSHSHSRDTLFSGCYYICNVTN